MAKLTWTANLNTGVDAIDKQHKKIVDYINQLDDVNSGREDRQLVAKVIINLVDYTVSHFVFEESMQEEARYPFLKAHKKLHELFVKRVSEYQERFRQGEDITAELHRLMFNWLYGHIKNEDMDYVPSIMSNLVRQEDFVEDTKGMFSKLFG